MMMTTTMPPRKKTPVILDTDLGNDIDDEFALVMALNSPEIDLLLVVTCTGDVAARAQRAARFLIAAGRTDIPIGLGLKGHPATRNDTGWASPDDLLSCTVVDDGVSAMIETILQFRGPGQPTPVIVGIGPLNNVSAAVDRCPEICSIARFVGMHGAIRKGYGGRSTVSAEYNVVKDIEAFYKVVTSPWREILLTPLDTCGSARLRGEYYARWVSSSDSVSPLVRELHSCYAHCLRVKVEELVRLKNRELHSESTVLFDTVAVWLAFSEKFVSIEKIRLHLDVTSGMLRENVLNDTESLKDIGAIRCAIDWIDRKEFDKELFLRLVKPS